MAKEIRRKIGLAVLAILLFGLTYYLTPRVIPLFRNAAEIISKNETFRGDSRGLKNTVILPALGSPVAKGKNNIWCSTFQLSWNQMKDSVIGEPIGVRGAEDLTDLLNAALQTREDISEESCYIAAGIVPEIVTRIQSELPRRFPSAEVPEFENLSPNSLLSYSYLNVYLRFRTPYRQYEKAFEFTDSQGNKTPVSAFGVWEGYLEQYSSLVKQVDLLYFSMDGHDGAVKECAIDLCRFTAPYQIVVALVDPEDTLEQTYNKVQGRIRDFQERTWGPEREFDDIDVLLVPEMFWEISHRFTELEGNPLSNRAYYGWPIIEASQVIRFRLDRSGVRLTSNAMFSVEAIPRYFEFNKPFLIYMKKRDANQPFFVMWVDNAELLTPFP